MDNHTDTLIIGAGPAGIAAAITLQKAGISNVIIDRCKFPRNKTCGGLITNKTVRVLTELLETDKAEDLSGVFCDESNFVEIYHNAKMSACTETDLPFRFVKRYDFDNYLVDIYRKLGGTMYENERSYTLDLEGKNVVLSQGNRISFENLIAADGALSPIRHMLGYKKPRHGFCIETHVSKEKVAFAERIKIYFGVVEKGYGWCFPSGDECCVGLGGVYSKKINYTSIMNHFLVMLGISPEDCRLKGAFVPYGNVTCQNSGPENIVLAGDAGGFVDPIYGEGIYFAISSGMGAAKARLDSDGNLRSNFNTRMDSYVKIIKQGTFLQKLFFGRFLKGFIIKKMHEKNSFIKYYCDNQISEYNYAYLKILELYKDYKREKRNNNKSL